jgi:hypothetical protein
MTLNICVTKFGYTFSKKTVRKTPFAGHRRQLLRLLRSVGMHNRRPTGVKYFLFWIGQVCYKVIQTEKDIPFVKYFCENLYVN